MDFKRVAVIGPGLLGGSILLALQSSPTVQTSLWARREEAVKDAANAGIADQCSSDLSEVVAEADLVILATPVSVMADLSQRMQPFLKEEAIITDVGSVKRNVVATQEAIFNGNSGPHFIGSHPMAGSEKLGIDQARANLFDGAACFVTPTSASDPASVKRVENFWESLGMKIFQISPGDHDAAVAAISHLPHAVAAVLVESALAEDESFAQYIAGGFRDTTRIASGSPEMWTGILLENREEVMSALTRFQSKIGDLLAFLETVDEGKLHDFLATAKNRRDATR